VKFQNPPRVFPLECPAVEIAGVPRRFGVGVLMILVTMFAVLFALMQSLDTTPRVFAIVAVLFVGVAAGQVLLFEGKKPRAASICVGAILFPLEIFALVVYEMFFGRHGWALNPVDVCFSLKFLIPGGALFGYLAGGLTAGIFLVLNRFRKDSDQPIVPPIQLQPLTEADIDTLLDWIRSPSLLTLWAGVTFSYPLDRPQLEQHLRRASGEDSDLRVFKAVCKDTGRSLGHVELGHIDKRLSSARIELALVSPIEPQRAQLSELLIRAILDVAFDELGLYRVESTALEFDTKAIACYKRVGFVKGILRGAIPVGERHTTVWIMRILESEWRSRQRELGPRAAAERAAQVP
jgi:RimJ/RimL family protein N-acetyltransferase